MNEKHRAIVREIAKKYYKAGDPLGWFEALYALSGDDSSMIPWADLEPNPSLVEWLDRNEHGGGGRALIVGSGLGDDAEELARRGFETTAFDISSSAIEQSRSRFPDSEVSYVVEDLLSAPEKWHGRFDFVFESYTLQALPYSLRAEAIRCIASLVASDGTLLVITRGREPDEPAGKLPWPLTRHEMGEFTDHGLREVSFEDYADNEDPPVRRFRVTFRRG